MLTYKNLMPVWCKAPEWAKRAKVVVSIEWDSNEPGSLFVGRTELVVAAVARYDRPAEIKTIKNDFWDRLIGEQNE